MCLEINNFVWMIFPQKARSDKCWWCLWTVTVFAPGAHLSWGSRSCGSAHPLRECSSCQSQQAPSHWAECLHCSKEGAFCSYGRVFLVECFWNSTENKSVVFFSLSVLGAGTGASEGVGFLQALLFGCASMPCFEMFLSKRITTINCI